MMVSHVVGAQPYRDSAGAFHERQMKSQRCGLGGSGEASPERIERRDVVVAGDPAVDEVVVVEHAGLFVPEELVDRGFAGGGAAHPLCGLVCMT